MTACFGKRAPQFPKANRQYRAPAFYFVNFTSLQLFTVYPQRNPTILPASMDLRFHAGSIHPELIDLPTSLLPVHRLEERQSRALDSNFC